MSLARHTSGKIFELVSQQGRTPTVVPGTGPTVVQFLLNSLPTQKDSKFWYYVQAIWVKVVAKLVVPTDSLFLGFLPEYLWQVVQSFQLQCPILGTLFATQNTRGTVLGNLIQKIGFGYNQLPTPNLLGAAGNTTLYYELWYRIPLALKCLANPSDTAPWAGFLEGGTLNVNIAPTTVMQDAGVEPSTTFTQAVVSASMHLQPEAEARIHVPFNFREHITPGNSTKHQITDMGSPDGYQGWDQSKAVGIGHLSALIGPAKTGLLAATTAPNITAFDIPWRDQQTVYNAELPLIEQFEALSITQNPSGGIAAVAGMAWPYVVGTTVPDGNTTFLNNLGLLTYPLISTPIGLYTSKLQSVAGAKEVNFQYTATPSGSQRWLGLYFGTFDEQFTQALVARINPGSKGEVRTKTLNKVGGVRNAGKLQYVPDKVVG